MTYAQKNKDEKGKQSEEYKKRNLEMIIIIIIMIITTVIEKEKPLKWQLKRL